MPAATSPLDLSQLYRGCVFHSNERVASHEQVSLALAEHDLHWRQGAVDAAMYTARVARLQLFVLRYGAPVDVRPRPFDDFVLVHMALKGCTEFDADGTRVCVRQGRTAVIAPRKRLTMAWGEGSEQLILKVPHALLGTRADVRPGSGLLAPGMDGQWHLLLQSLLGVLALAPDPGHGAWIEHLERAVGGFLGAGVARPGADTKASQGAGAGDAGAARRLDALERYMRAKLCAPVSLCDLAAAANVSVRTLNDLCRRHHGVAPMELLRNMRLDAVHAVLQNRLDAGVTATAVAHGFGNPGRFAAYYRARFGELPRHAGRPH